jgi:phage tail-like protein
VILKRGVTPTQHLWRWFELVAGGRYAIRLDARLVHLGPGEDPETCRGALEWRMANALPVKFRAATMTAASANEVAVEELHFVHEGLALVVQRPGGGGAGR